MQILQIQPFTLKMCQINPIKLVCRCTRHRTVHELEQELDAYMEDDHQIDLVNVTFFNFGSKH